MERPSPSIPRRSRSRGPATSTRVLTVYSKTFYTVDKGVQRGAAFDAGRLFVEDLLETPLRLELAGAPN